MIYFQNCITNELLTREEALAEIKDINTLFGTNFSLEDCVKDKVYRITEVEEG